MVGSWRSCCPCGSVTTGHGRPCLEAGSRRALRVADQLTPAPSCCSLVLGQVGVRGQVPALRLLTPYGALTPLALGRESADSN